MIIDISKKEKKAKGDFMCRPLEKLCGKSAEYILETYGNKYKYPVDIVKIVNNIGDIDLGTMDFTGLNEILSIDDESSQIIGAVRVLENRLQIICSEKFDESRDAEYPDMSPEKRKDKLWRRQRFTIAHELAHCCNDIDSTQERNYIEFRSKNKKYEYNKKEKVANIFAGELLMPRNILDVFLLTPQKYNLTTPDGKVSIKKLADAFLVNNHVMLERLRHLIKVDGLYSGVRFDTTEITDAEDFN